MFEADRNDFFFFFPCAADQIGFLNRSAEILFTYSRSDFLVFALENPKTAGGRFTGTTAKGVIAPARPPPALQRHPRRLQGEAGAGD